MQYAWLILSFLIFAVWCLLYFLLRDSVRRKEMVTVSFLTSLLGLTEPVFVPEYWNPPSLFDLAYKTRFDIESLIFSFAVGGIALVFYDIFFQRRYIGVSHHERHRSRHRFHIFALASAPIVFIVFLASHPFNPIYSASLAMVVGFFATSYCRPDLVKKMLVSGFLFFLIYFFSFFILETLFPGYVQKVWNLKALSGIFFFAVPMEELLWAFTFGLYWSSVYEHFQWRAIK